MKFILIKIFLFLLSVLNIQYSSCAAVATVASAEAAAQTETVHSEEMDLKWLTEDMIKYARTVTDVVPVSISMLTSKISEMFLNGQHREFEATLNILTNNKSCFLKNKNLQFAILNFLQTIICVATQSNDSNFYMKFLEIFLAYVESPKDTIETIKIYLERGAQVSGYIQYLDGGLERMSKAFKIIIRLEKYYPEYLQYLKIREQLPDLLLTRFPREVHQIIVDGDKISSFLEWEKWKPN